MSDNLKKISLDDMPAEFAITDGEGNIVMLITHTESGYISVDFEGLKRPEARVFELGGPAQEHGPTISARHDVALPHTGGSPSYLNVDGHVE